ncbi:TPA: IS4 family transposase, partial [Bacillus thuringiensis]|nr:IS4 family transposase [Bacillus thuringiensis]
KKELSEYKSIYMIQNYYLLFYEGLQKGIHELLKVLLRLFYLLEKNGKKSHRYKKKTVFDILGVVYNFTMSHNHVA